MKVKLYDCVKHWNNYDQIYLYSDPHFSDEEMKVLRKNYIGDEEQIKRINSVCNKRTLFVCLGDVGNTDFIKRIKGDKVLIMGNHDSGASNYKRIQSKELLSDDIEDHYKYLSTKYHNYIINKLWSDETRILGKATFYHLDNCLFDEVYEGALIINEKIILSHEPVDIPFMLNIHGHDHSNWGYQDNNHINLCAEHIDYTPVSLKSIVESGRLKNIDSIHRMTIDNATERAKERGYSLRNVKKEEETKKE